jgi:hypothetical protein
MIKNFIKFTSIVYLLVLTNNTYSNDSKISKSKIAQDWGSNLPQDLWKYYNASPDKFDCGVERPGTQSTTEETEPKACLHILGNVATEPKAQLVIFKNKDKKDLTVCCLKQSDEQEVAKSICDRARKEPASYYNSDECFKVGP